MKKFITGWGFIFSLSIIVLFFIFFYSLYRSEMAPPLKGWSRAISISVINNNEAVDFAKTRISSVPIEGSKLFITLWQVDSTLNYKIIDYKGRIQKTGKTEYYLPESFDMKAVLNDGIIDIYSQTADSLIRYAFDWNKGKIVSKKLIEKKVTGFIVFDNIMVCSTDKSVNIIDDSGNIRKIYDMPSKMLDISKYNKNSYIILIPIEKENGNIDYKYVIYDMENHSVSKFDGFQVPIMHNYSMASSAMNVVNGRISILSVIREWETGKTITLYINHPVGNASDPVIQSLEIEGYNPNPMFIKDGANEMKFIASTANRRGMNLSTINLAMYTVKNNQISEKIFMTKTRGVSQNPQLFKIGNDSYLQWEDIGGENTKIYFSSTNPDVIKLADKTGIKDLTGLFLNTIVGSLWGIAFIILMFMALAMPNMIFIVAAAVVSINWFESNTRKILNICIVIQLIAKILFLMKFQLGNILIREWMPGFFQSSYGLIIAITAATIVSAFCVKRRYSGERSRISIIEQYIFFTIIDLILYSLIFFPYYSI